MRVWEAHKGDVTPSPRGSGMARVDLVEDLLSSLEIQNTVHHYTRSIWFAAYDTSCSSR